jgi:hypothetical protein
MQITTLFNALSFLYLLRSLKVAHTVWQQWPQLKKQSSLTPEQKGLVEQASFFLAVPIGVFFHELAHALAIWAFGGRVVEFGYRFFWGFVRPDRGFPPTQEWVIAIAGTVGSLLFGLVVWLLLIGRPPFLAYFGLHTFRYQLYFSLLAYPVFTLLSLFGDWQTIYNFQATPLLSGITAVAHVGLLGWFWWANRRGWFEKSLTHSVRDKYEQLNLDRTAENQPDHEQQILRIIELKNAGALNQAFHELTLFLKDNPDSAVGHLAMAVIQAEKGRGAPPASVAQHAEKALSLGLPDAYREATAYLTLGGYLMHREKTVEAIRHLTQGLDVLGKENHPLLKAKLYFYRAIAYRRHRRYQEAYDDIQQAITLAEAAGLEQNLRQYQSERETIQRHAGRPLGPTPAGV